MTASPQISDLPQAKSCILILGMHRSGTSALAGLFSLMGCDVAKTLLPDSPTNKKGYFEGRNVFDLHNRLLKSARSDWDDWTAIDPAWLSSDKTETFRSQALDILNEDFASSGAFVIKDPRICRIAPWWFDILDRFGATPLIVHTHRDPIEVAASLERRNGFATRHSLLLWLRHVLDAEQASRGKPRYFTSFDRVLTDWTGVVGDIQTRFDFDFPKGPEAVTSDVASFLEADLRHRVADHPTDSQLSQLLAWVDQAHEIVERWSQTGEDAADFPALDALRARLDSDAPTFTRVHLTSLDVDVFKTELRTARQDRAATEARIADYHAPETVNRLLHDVETRFETRCRSLEETNRTQAREIAQRFDELAALTRLLRSKEDQAAKGYQELQKRADLAETRLKAIETSTFWRATAPLRHLVDLMRRRR